MFKDGDRVRQPYDQTDGTVEWSTPKGGVCVQWDGNEGCEIVRPDILELIEERKEPGA